MMENKICVYAICKNESKFVEEWVKSMSEADYIVVLDTGSSDDTVEKLKSLGVYVEQKIYDKFRFDVARNDSMKLIPKEYNILVCTDLDEVFEPGWAKELRENWVEGKHVRCLYKYAMISDENKNPVKIIYYNKIHNRDWRWEYPVHEKLIFKNDEENITNEQTLYLIEKIYLHHYADRSKPRTQYFELLELRKKEYPEDLDGLFYLAGEYESAGRTKDAIDILKEGYEKCPDSNLLFKFAFLDWIARISFNYGFENDALKYAKESLNYIDYYREPYYIIGSILNNKCDINGSYEILKRGINNTYFHYDWVENNDLYKSKYYDLFSIVSFYSGHKAESLIYANMAYKNDMNNERLKNNINLILISLSDEDLKTFY